MIIKALYLEMRIEMKKEKKHMKLPEIKNAFENIHNDCQKKT